MEGCKVAYLRHEKNLRTNEARIEGSRYGDVCSALNQCPAIRKDGERVRRAFEAKQHLVEADGSVGERRAASSCRSTGRLCSWIWTEFRPQRVI